MSFSSGFTNYKCTDAGFQDSFVPDPWELFIYDLTLALASAVWAVTHSLLNH